MGILRALFCEHTYIASMYLSKLSVLPPGVYVIFNAGYCIIMATGLENVYLIEILNERNLSLSPGNIGDGLKLTLHSLFSSSAYAIYA